MSSAKWMTEFADLDLTAPSKERNVVPGENQALERVDMELGVAYPASVVAAKVVTSNRGDVQLQVTFALHADSHDQPPIGKDTEWLTLPFQESDSQLPSRDTVRKVTLRRRDDLVRILSAAEPQDFQLYARREGVGRDAVYYDHRGHKLDRAAMNDRERAINGAALQWADELHAKSGSFVDRIKGAQLYIVKAANPKNEKYPYLNLYAVRPDKLPVHGTPF